MIDMIRSGLIRWCKADLDVKMEGLFTVLIVSMIGITIVGLFVSTIKELFK